MTGMVVRTVIATAGSPPIVVRTRGDVTGELPRDRRTDEVAGARDTGLLSRAGECGIARALSRGVEHGIAHVQREGELHDGEREHHEQDCRRG